MRVYGVQPKQEAAPASDKQYLRLLEQVQLLNDRDTRCLLDYLLGVRKVDSGLLAQVEAWLKQNVTPVRKLTLAELQEITALAAGQAGQSTATSKTAEHSSTKGVTSKP